MSSAADRSWLNPKIEVRDSPIEGRGLFAREEIAAGETVIVMGGRVMSDAEFRQLNLEKYSAAQIGEDTHILLDTPNPAECGNHSCDANTWMRDAVTTEAKRVIRRDEEVTIDYATLTADPGWSMACNCRTSDCRGRVRGDDWQRPEVQVRYEGHLSPFLNSRITVLREGHADVI